jgi:hypothetical protein
LPPFGVPALPPLGVPAAPLAPEVPEPPLALVPAEPPLDLPPVPAEPLLESSSPSCSLALPPHATNAESTHAMNEQANVVRAVVVIASWAREPTRD